MHYDTTTVFAVAPDADQAAAVVAKQSEMRDAGKTQDTGVTVINQDPWTGVRHWVDEAAAEEWKTFILSVGAQSSTVTLDPN